MTTHPFRWIPFVFGALFALTLAGWAAFVTGVFDINQLGIVGPVALIAIGLLGVALTFRKKES